MIKAILLLIICSNLMAGEVKDFKLPAYRDGNIFHLNKEMRKYNKVVINFWASWCAGCIEELKDLERLKNNYASKTVLFIAINAGEKRRKIKRFLKRYNFSYQILEDKDRTFSKSLGVESLPQTIVINNKRKILFRGDRPPKTL